jgi:hypothetical protein
LQNYNFWCYAFSSTCRFVKQNKNVIYGELEVGCMEAIEAIQQICMILGISEC